MSDASREAPQSGPTLDDGALPAAPSPETLRLAILYVQRDLRQVQRDLAANGRLDEDDRRLLATLDERTERILHIMDRKPLAQIVDAFSKLFGLGDNARRPWVWVVLLVALLLAAAAWYGRDTYFDPGAREDRERAAQREDRRLERQFRLDSMRALRPSPSVEISGPGTRVETPAEEPSPDSSPDASDSTSPE